MVGTADEKKVICPNCNTEIDVSFVITKSVICPECRTNVSLGGEAIGEMTMKSIFDAAQLSPPTLKPPTETVVPSSTPQVSAPPSAATVITSQQASPQPDLASTVAGAPQFTQKPPPSTPTSEVTDPAKLNQGDEVGNFVIERVLGRGAMGVVLLANDTILDRLVALKFMAKELVDNQLCHDRFIREGRMMANLRAHQNLVAIYSGGTLGRTPYFAMEYVEGHSVKEVLKQKGRFTIDKAIDICRQTAEALDFVWSEAQLVHRDIKPSNMMFDKDGTTVKVTDFGLAKPHEHAGDSGLTATGIILGTPDYLAPELARCEKHLDCRTDIYALGATLFHLVAGRAPFKGNSIAEVVSAHLREEAPLLNNFVNETPDVLVELVASMLDKEPGNRPATYREIISALANLG